MPSTTALLGDKPIRRMGFGAMQLAGPGVFGPPRDPDAARAVLRRAIELGVDHVDTAQFYGPDVVNDLIRETLLPYPDELKLVTKVGARRDEKGAWLPAQTPDELRAGVEANLRSLQVERMDLVNLRLHAAPGGAAAVALEEQVGALVDLRDEGKLDLIGISNATLEQFEAARALTELGEVQNAYSLLDRQDDPLVDRCAELGVAFVPFFPLGSAFGDGRKVLAEDPAVRTVAEKHGATHAQVALAWLLARSPTILLIPGTTSVAHLEENIAAEDFVLDLDDLATLEGVQRVPRPAA